MMLKLVALALVLSVVSGAPPGGKFLEGSHVEDVDDVDDGSVEEQATKLVSLLQVENGDRSQAALRGSRALLPPFPRRPRRRSFLPQPSLLMPTTSDRNGPSKAPAMKVAAAKPMCAGDVFQLGDGTWKCYPKKW
jgi:hypothetical protein